jgi:hypothetical protein
MPSLEVSVPHQLSQDDALSRVKQYLAQLKMQHADKVSGVVEIWNGYVGKLKVSSKFSGSGTITVNPSDVTVKSSLPLLAIPFKGKIESAIHDALAAALA